MAIVEIRYVTLLPYCRAKGCQNNRPHPQRRKKYPVPALRLATLTSSAEDKGTKTEYTTDRAIPTNQVYLHSIPCKLLQIRATHTIGWNLQHDTSQSQTFPARRPIQGILRISGWRRDKNNILMAPGMTSCQVLVNVDQLDSARHLGLVDVSMVSS